MTLTRRIFAEKRRLIYPVIIAIVLNAALYAAVIYPLSLKEAGGERAAQIAEKQLQSAKRDYESARATATGKVSADAELEKFYTSVLPIDQSEARRITFLKIEQLAKAAHVAIVNRQFDPKQERDSTLGKLSISVALTGQYRDVRRFIYDLETAPEFLILENVALQQGSDTDRGLSVNIKVATYYRAGLDEH
ncbi:MAG TPA: type 4a pilus biogenesis protein PilO [Vicinamibacterales bacterium]|jgi:Tfp pilus assembly protein PilO|nr:type 4a pilus biogenesis protein PilO [Vicinamibacterales bacterium]